MTFDDLFKDPVAVATLALVVVTAVLALATGYLSWKTRELGREAAKQLVQSFEVEKARRSEVAILNAVPPEIGEYRIEWDENAPWIAFEVRNVSNGPIHKVTTTIRSNDLDASASPSWSALAGGESHTFRLPLAPYIEFEGDPRLRKVRTIVGNCEVNIESFGQLNQRVLQTYALRIERLFPGATEPAFYESRFQVVPGPVGVHSTDIRYEA